jgi:hypothetical protein
MSHSVVECPHCRNLLFLHVKPGQTLVFRHGILKENFNLVDPNVTNEECQLLLQNKKVIGCCKLFCVHISNKKWYTLPLLEEEEEEDL